MKEFVIKRYFCRIENKFLILYTIWLLLTMAAALGNKGLLGWGCEATPTEVGVPGAFIWPEFIAAGVDIIFGML